jgi:hypothetical protein
MGLETCDGYPANVYEIERNLLNLEPEFILRSKPLNSTTVDRVIDRASPF